jgi:RecB family exonuclease
LALHAAATPHPHWHALRAQAPPLQKFVDELAPPFSPALERARGVATLRAQSRCAFRGFAEIRLAAEPLTEPTPGFNAAERGELVHQALQELWKSLRDSATLHALRADAQYTLLRQAADSAVRTVIRRRDPGARWQTRERERLVNLLEKWLAVERERAAFSIESLEEEAPPAQFAGLQLQVRLDRVDRLGDGSRVLIDYKTGAAAVDWRGERPDNPQLPLYALLEPQALAAVAYAKVNAADPCFVAESERKDIFRPGSRKTALEGQPSLAALVEVWSRRIASLADAFMTGRAEVAPTPSACRSCNLQGFCRVPTVLQEPDADD